MGDSGGKPGSYRNADAIERGWEIWTRGGWARVASVHLGESVLITLANGRVFEYTYLDPVLCRGDDQHAGRSPSAAASYRRRRRR